MEIRLKEVCKAKGFTLSQIAEKLDISRETLSRSINGNITLNRLSEIADIIGVQVTELISVNQLSGFVEYNGTIYRIQSVQDIERLLIKGN
jgi:transcriptional regulator with XRE-family HTH domain